MSAVMKYPYYEVYRTEDSYTNVNGVSSIQDTFICRTESKETAKDVFKEMCERCAKDARNFDKKVKRFGAYILKYTEEYGSFTYKQNNYFTKKYKETYPEDYKDYLLRHCNEV